MIGVKIRYLRKRKGITMKQLGAAIGLTESAIGLYENDKRTPDYKTLKKIALYFDVPIAYLLNEGIYGKEEILLKNADIIMNYLKETANEDLVDLYNNVDKVDKMKILASLFEDVEYDKSTDSIRLISKIDFFSRKLFDKKTLILSNEASQDSDENSDIYYISKANPQLGIQKLPPEAIEEIENYIAYIKVKYNTHEKER